MLGHLVVGLLEKGYIAEEIHELAEAGYKITGLEIPEELYVSILGPEEVLSQQPADGDLPEGSGNLNLVYVDIVVGQGVDGLAQSNPACMVFRVGIHVEEEVLAFLELVPGRRLDKVCKMCKFME